MADVADTDRDPVLIREKWQLRPEERIILFVGRLDSIKGVRFLIRAFRKVSRQYLDSRLWIVGDGDYKDCFEEANPIFSQVTLTGFLDRPRCWSCIVWPMSAWFPRCLSLSGMCR